jgi:hypothetical protein
MGFDWLLGHWFDFIETVGVVGSLLFTAHTVRKDERARQITNMLTISDRNIVIWSKLFDHPQLSRILKMDMDLDKEPVTDEESVFIKMLLLHLDTVRRAMDAGLFVTINGLQSDIRFFLSLPIPKAVWEKIKPFQDQEFVKFVETALQ